MRLDFFQCEMPFSTLLCVEVYWHQHWKLPLYRIYLHTSSYLLKTPCGRNNRNQHLYFCISVHNHQSFPGTHQYLRWTQKNCRMTHKSYFQIPWNYKTFLNRPHHKHHNSEVKVSFKELFYKILQIKIHLLKYIFQHGSNTKGKKKQRYG